MIIRKYNEKDLAAMIAVWNEVVEDGIAFPQEELLDNKTGAEFFASQSYCSVAENEGTDDLIGPFLFGKAKFHKKGHRLGALILNYTLNYHKESSSSDWNIWLPSSSQLVSSALW